MSPGGHLMTAVLAAGAGLVLTGSAPLAAGIVAGGFLIDVDHLADYLIVERRRELTPAAFLRHYIEGHTRRVVLVLHSYELWLALAALAWWLDSAWLAGYLAGGRCTWGSTSSSTAGSRRRISSRSTAWAFASRTASTPRRSSARSPASRPQASGARSFSARSSRTDTRSARSRSRAPTASLGPGDGSATRSATRPSPSFSGASSETGRWLISSSSSTCSTPMPRAAASSADVGGRPSSWLSRFFSPP